jgi:hypothetical protein
MTESCCLKYFRKLHIFITDKESITPTMLRWRESDSWHCPEREITVLSDESISEFWRALASFKETTRGQKSNNQLVLPT